MGCLFVNGKDRSQLLEDRGCICPFHFYGLENDRWACNAPTPSILFLLKRELYTKVIANGLKPSLLQQTEAGKSEANLKTDLVV